MSAAGSAGSGSGADSGLGSPSVPGGAALAPALAATAELPLGPGRAAIAGALLAAWLPAANELSRKMSSVEPTALLPVTVFAHAAPDSAG